MRIIKVKIKDPINLLIMLYYCVLILLHYLTIGKVLPNIQSDIHVHLKCTQILLDDLNAYSCYRYLGFHILLLLLLISSPGSFSTAAGLLVFANLISIFLIYKFFREFFHSSLPSFFATLSLSMGNLIWVRLIPCIGISNSRAAYSCFRPFEALIFNSSFNISNYLWLSFLPLTVSLSITFFLISYIASDRPRYNSLLIYIFIIFNYLVHPFYALLFPFLLVFALFLSLSADYDKLSAKYRIIKDALLCSLFSGFMPLLISNLMFNISPIARFQDAMFSLVNAGACLIMRTFLSMSSRIFILIKKISSTKFSYIINLTLLVLLLAFLIYSINKLYTLHAFNAWNLRRHPTPLWLYPAVIGIGPLLIMISHLLARDTNVRTLSFICLLLPMVFVIPAPILDYVNFSLLGYHVNGISNLLYLIGSGISIGSAISRINNYFLKYVIILSLFAVAFIQSWVVSIKYWIVMYQNFYQPA